MQTSMLRLVALVTARYNWQRDEVSIGQAELSGLWGVTDRTVKREIKRLIESGYLIRTREGVKGRVAAYRLNHHFIAQVSQGCASSIGSDFAARVQSQRPVEQEQPKVLQLAEFVDRQQNRKIPENGTPWSQVCSLLKSRDPANYANWYSRLDGTAEGVTLVLEAQGGFLSGYVATHLADTLEQATRDALGPEWSVSIRRT
ncbi:hypothetical protein [Qingshengfaniella alkalisoli]|uniref:DnaA N-terminal domain-containing protein n=1 Tax=Qingshengfaniella alkalisoli TaxID=2599296 RepID=A0A5B8J0G6_9RHOB|nr:hypothetical protein [Qingshengfaniella alkalisoli]QDY71283.1 hypothetical protein FPZ52_16485 [Qingshengfaniella alkalisoli]